MHAHHVSVVMWNIGACSNAPNCWAVESHDKWATFPRRFPNFWWRSPRSPLPSFSPSFEEGSWSGKECSEGEVEVEGVGEAILERTAVSVVMVGLGWALLRLTSKELHLGNRWGYEFWVGLVMEYLMHGAGESNIDPWWGISRIKDLHWRLVGPGFFSLNACNLQTVPAMYCRCSLIVIMEKVFFLSGYTILWVCPDN